MKKIHQRKSAINVDINCRIKELQQKLVTLSFSKGDNTADYYAVLGKIKQLRRQIFKGSGT
ncbi:MAG: hypothetical protein AB8B80_08200 [Marinicellaceae bacterium]